MTLISRCDHFDCVDCLIRRAADTSDELSSTLACDHCQLSLAQLDDEVNAIGQMLSRASVDHLVPTTIEQAGRRQNSDDTDVQNATPTDKEFLNANGIPKRFPVVERFQIIELLGEGGMGSVYLADQVQPIKRRVALKVIKPGMDSQEIVARFDAERQALAMMDHPAIARIFEGGLTDRGRPYFAMELVDGVPITDYCDLYRLSITDRLRLFLQACQATQHAHQKGIIHRDLKPSNILVAEQIGQADVKVIDFGLAKALVGQLTGEGTLTRASTAIGTLRYMSPELAGGEAAGVDTRSDVYSLGAVLYELLTGSTPITKSTTARESSHRVMELIRSQPPVRASKRVLDTQVTTAFAVEARQCDASGLSRRLRQDLDWILLRAVEIDPQRRYQTVAALSADIQRYLSAEPVEARPPSTIYRLRRLTAKHRIAMSVAAAFIVVLATTSAISTKLYLSAESARVRAVKSEQAATAARNEAQEAERAAVAQTKSANEITDFLGEVLAPARPSFLFALNEESSDSRSRAERVRDELGNEPLVQARLMDVVGHVYLGIGNVRQAETFLTDAYRIRRRQLPVGHPELADSLHNMAELRLFQGRNDESLRLSQEAYEIRKSAFGEEDPKTLNSRIMELFAQFDGPHMEDAQRRVEVVSQLATQWQEVLDMRVRHVPNHHIDIANLRLILGGQAAFLGDNLAAMKQIGFALASYQQLGSAHHTGKLLQLYVQGEVHKANRNIEAYLASMQKAIDKGVGIFNGNEFHPALLHLRMELLFHLTSKDYEAAEELARETLAGCREVYGNQPRTADILSKLGNVLTRSSLAKAEEGITHTEAAIEIYERWHGPHSYLVGRTHSQLGRNLAWKSKTYPQYTEKAAFHLRKSLETFRQAGLVDYDYLDFVSCDMLIWLAEYTDNVNPHFLAAAIDNLNLRVATYPQAAEPLLERGKLHRALGNLDAAADDYFQSLQLLSPAAKHINWSSIPGSWVRLAGWANIGEHDEVYDAARQHLVKNFGETANPAHAESFALVGLLSPCGGAEMQAIERWVQVAETSLDRDAPAHVFARGLLQYRQGKFAAAAKTLGNQRDGSANSDRLQAAAQALLALAERGQGLIDEAEERLAAIDPEQVASFSATPAAYRLIPKDTRRVEYSVDQLDWISFQTLWKEATVASVNKRP